MVAQEFVIRLSDKELKKLSSDTVLSIKKALKISDFKNQDFAVVHITNG